MKNLIFLLLPFLYLNVLNITAQETGAEVFVDSTWTFPPKYNCNDKKDEQVKIFNHKNGELKLTGFCKQGKQVGFWMAYFDNGKIEIKATKVDLKEVDKIEIPDDGKEVTGEEYEKIVEEKMKEMAKEYGGNGTILEIRG